MAKKKVEEASVEVIEQPAVKTKELFDPATKTLRIVVAIIAIITLILSIAIGSIAESNKEKAEAECDAFYDAHYVEKTYQEKSYSYWSKSYTYNTYTYSEWDSEENEETFYAMSAEADMNYYQTKALRPLFGGISTVFIMAYLGIAGIIMAIYNKCSAYITWLKTLYDDTAKKLIAAIKLIAKLLCVITLAASFAFFVYGLFEAIAYGMTAFLLAGIIAPFAALLACLVLQVSTAISVMTINMIADVSSIKKKTCDEDK